MYSGPAPPGSQLKQSPQAAASPLSLLPASTGRAGVTSGTLSQVPGGEGEKERRQPQEYEQSFSKLSPLQEIIFPSFITLKLGDTQ